MSSQAQCDLSIQLDKLDPEARKLVQMLQQQIEVLRSKLMKANGQKGEKQYTLEEAKDGLNKAAARLMEGDESAQADFDKWDKVISEHPDHLKKLANERYEWEKVQFLRNQACYQITRGFVPSDIKCITLQQLMNAGMKEELARRIFSQKALWLVREEKKMISKLHIADLKTKFSTQGLDLVELRAVYHALPIEFENDSNGSKMDWREGIRSKLETCVREEQSAKLRTCKFRHKCYYNLKNLSLHDMPYLDSASLSDEAKGEIDNVLSEILLAFQKQSKRKVKSKQSSFGKRVGQLDGSVKANLVSLLAAHSDKEGSPIKESKRRIPANAERDKQMKDDCSSESQAGNVDLHLKKLTKNTKIKATKLHHLQASGIRSDAKIKKLSMTDDFMSKLARAQARNAENLEAQAANETGAEVRKESPNSLKETLEIGNFVKKSNSSQLEDLESTRLGTKNPNTIASREKTDQFVQKTSNEVTKRERAIPSKQSDGKQIVLEARRYGIRRMEDDKFCLLNSVLGEEKDWLKIEKDLCLQEKPLHEQVSMLENMLQSLLSPTPVRSNNEQQLSGKIRRQVEKRVEDQEVFILPAHCEIAMENIETFSVSQTVYENFDSTVHKAYTQVKSAIKQQVTRVSEIGSSKRNMQVDCSSLTSITQREDPDWLLVQKRQ